jgi:hypothetical protein
MKKEQICADPSRARALCWPDQVPGLLIQIPRLEWIFVCALLPPVIMLISASCFRNFGECHGRTALESTDAISRIERS